MGAEKSSAPAPVAQDITDDEQEMLKACPHFGPIPARDQWIDGWQAARRGSPTSVAQAADMREALQAARDALEEIALAGMSGTGQESEDGMRAWHARRAWEFIGIAARTLDPIRAALAAPAPVAHGITDDDIRRVFLANGFTVKEGQTDLKPYVFAAARALLELAAPAPVAQAIGSEWMPCMKLPVVVHVREQRPGEAHVSTREGITPVKPDDLIMRGVSGEEYPIGRAIFEQTYKLVEATGQEGGAA